MIKEIEITFENTDSVVIPGKYIGMIDIGDLDRRIIRSAVNYIHNRTVARTIAVELFRGAEECKVTDGTGALSRIERTADIASLKIKYKDGTEETLYTDYTEDRNRVTNRNQTSYRSKYGHLYLVISANKIAEYLFPRDWAENPEREETYELYIELAKTEEQFGP